MTHSIPRGAGLRLRSTAASFALVLLAGVSLALVSVGARAAESKEKSQSVSHIIGKEMAAAQEALKKGQWQDALKNCQAAEAKSPLTAFDKKSIYDFEAFAYIKMQNYKAALEAYDKEIATGAVPAGEVSDLKHRMFQLSAATQQYGKAIEIGKDLADAGSLKVDDYGLIAQLYFLQKDCKNSGAWADKAVAAARKAGEAPKENWYQFKLQCASDASDNAGMVSALIDLVRLTNKTNYWNSLLRLERQDERDDHNLLMIYRIMYDTGSMNADSDYIEMAQLLGDAALPGEAATVLEKALAAGVVKDEHKERTNRLLGALKTRADADKKGLPQYDAEAAKNAQGEASVKLGEVYFGAGDYTNAAAAINRGLQKGQVKHLDEAYVYLGRADVALKNVADAKKAFGGLKSVPNISPRVLRLWELYSEKLGS